MPKAPTKAEAVLVFGGDGTVHRHLPDLVRQGLPFLVVPCGSGNDFARALKLRSPRDAALAWHRFCSQRDNVRSIDLGVITPMDGPGQAGVTSLSDRTKHYFCTIGGLGLDGEVIRRAERLPQWLRGHGGYALSLPGALARYRPIRTKVLTPNETGDAFVARSNDLLFLAAFGNTTTYGGGMRIAPQARSDDGKLDVCAVRNLGKLKLLRSFPRVYFGRHIGIAEVDYFQTDRLRLEPEQPMDVYADGEHICHTPIEVSVSTRVLKVIVPS